MPKEKRSYNCKNCRNYTIYLIIFFEDFEHSKYAFKGFMETAGEGVNGNRALVLHRKPGDKSYALAHFPVNLKPAMKYRFELQYKIEDFEGSGWASPGVSFAAIEYYQKKPSGS